MRCICTCISIMQWMSLRTVPAFTDIHSFLSRLPWLLRRFEFSRQPVFDLMPCWRYFYRDLLLNPLIKGSTSDPCDCKKTQSNARWLHSTSWNWASTAWLAPLFIGRCKRTFCKTGFGFVKVFRQTHVSFLLRNVKKDYVTHIDTVCVGISSEIDEPHVHQFFSV